MCWLATDTVLAAGWTREWREPIVAGSTLALLQYTSGSTAEPKGVLINHGNLLHNSAYIHRLFKPCSIRTGSPLLGCRPITTWG